MPPEAIILIGQILLKYGPGLAQAIAGLFHKETVTQEDWDKVFALAEKSYDDYVHPIAGPASSIAHPAS